MQGAMTKGLLVFILFLSGCAALARTSDDYRDPNMDFGSVTKVAILPLANYSREQGASERVRDVLSNMLMATGSIYVVPPGEVARSTGRLGIANPSTPSIEEVQKLGTNVQVNAVITGAIREYGEVRSGNVTSNVISLSLQMIETQTGKVIWSASSTEGGISIWARLFGGGGKPMNAVTEKCVNDLIEKLYK